MPEVRVASVIAALLIVAAVSTFYLQRNDRQIASQAEPASHRTREQPMEPVASLETAHHAGKAESAASTEVEPPPRSIDGAATSPPDRAKSTATQADVTAPLQGGPVTGTVTSASGGGHTFPVSKSVRSDCEGNSRGVGICVDVAQLLKTFNEEPRDVSWASDMEARIRTFVNSEEGKFTIRALECRTSVCAVEVESIHGPYLGVDYETQVANGVEDSVASFGDEKDALGQDVTVTLRLIERN